MIQVTLFLFALLITHPVLANQYVEKATSDAHVATAGEGEYYREITSGSWVIQIDKKYHKSYTAARETLHKTIVNDRVKKAHDFLTKFEPIQRFVNNRIVFVRGVPGAGKSTFVHTVLGMIFEQVENGPESERLLNEFEKIFIIDLDDLRWELPEFREWQKLDRQHEARVNASKWTQQEAGFIRDQLVQRFVQEKLPCIIIPTLMVKETDVDRIVRGWVMPMKEAKFEVALITLETTEEMQKQNIVARSQAEGGRFMDPQQFLIPQKTQAYIEDAYVKNQSTFDYYDHLRSRRSAFFRDNEHKGMPKSLLKMFGAQGTAFELTEEQAQKGLESISQTRFPGFTMYAFWHKEHDRFVKLNWQSEVRHVVPAKRLFVVMRGLNVNPTSVGMVKALNENGIGAEATSTDLYDNILRNSGRDIKILDWGTIRMPIFEAWNPLVIHHLIELNAPIVVYSDLNTNIEYFDRYITAAKAKGYQPIIVSTPLKERPLYEPSKHRYYDLLTNHGISEKYLAIVDDQETLRIPQITADHESAAAFLSALISNNNAQAERLWDDLFTLHREEINFGGIQLPKGGHLMLGGGGAVEYFPLFRDSNGSKQIN